MNIRNLLSGVKPLTCDPAQYQPLLDRLAAIGTLQTGEDKGLFTLFSIKEGRPKPDIIHVLNSGDAVFVAKRLGRAVEVLAQTEGANVYLMPNLVRTGTKGRGKKEDILSLLAIVVEFDKQHDPASRHTRLPVPPHAEVESSPGNFHSWYFLDHPALPVDAVPTLCALVDAIGSDDCKTADHAFRCPGTWNYPNAKKIEAGRSPEPVMSQLVDGDTLELNWMMKGVPSIFLTQLAAEITVKYPGAFAAQEEKQRTAVTDDDFDWEQRAASLVPLSEAEVDEYWNSPKTTDRSEAAFAFFCAAVRRGHSPAEIVGTSLTNLATAVGEHYKSKSDPEGALRKEIRKAFIEAAAGITAKTGETSTEEEDGAATDLKLALNAKYAVVKYGNKALIADTSRQEIEFMRGDDFKMLHANEFISTPNDEGKPTRKLLVPAWLASKECRKYTGRGAVFEPTQPRAVAGDMLNLWPGFAVEPKQGDCTRLWDHLRDVVCSGNLLHYAYMRNWFAACVQWLDDPGQVVLVTRGAHGSGKGVLFRTIVQLFGQHGAHILNADQITGKFNALMIRNRTRYMIASNHALPAHIEAGDRRHFVVQCADTYAHDGNDTAEQRAIKRAYWKALFYGGEQLGIMPDVVKAAFLYDLQHIDLAAFDISDIPQSNTKSDLIRRSLSGVDAWLDHILHDGAIWSNHWAPDGLTIPKDDAYHAYQTFAQGRKEWQIDIKDHWMKTVLKALGPAAWPSRNRLEGSRIKTIQFAALSLCQQEFSKACQSTFEAMGWTTTDTDMDEIDAFLGNTWREAI